MKNGRNHGHSEKSNGLKRCIACLTALLPLPLLTCCEMFVGDLDKKAASVGIIGGADGPTAIFITTKINWPQVLIAAAAAVALVVLLVRYFKKNK